MSQSFEPSPFEAKEPHQSTFMRIAHAMWTFAKGYFIAIGVLVTICSVGLTIFLATIDPGMLEESTSPLPKISADAPAVLKLTVDTPILSRSASSTEVFLQRLFDEKPGIYLPKLRRTLETAKHDPRITRLDIELNLLQGSIAEIAEMRRILEDFREGGKPIHMSLNDLGTWHYYLASAADTITLNPTASANLTGPMFQLIYFGEALRKIGVDIEVVRFGKYKAAFEPFIQNAPSAPTLEQYESMEDSIREHLIEVIAKGRDRDAEEVRGWLTQSIFTARDALDRGIIDAIGYGPEAAGIANMINASDPVTIAAYNRVVSDEPKRRQSVENQGGIALIEASGEIVMDSPASDPDVISPEPLIKQLQWAGENEDVKAVVLRVNSPGGSATAADLIWREVAALKDKKPVVVSMGAVAASGGYYISAPASKIIAEPTTITGSIGVIGMLPNFGPFEEKYGVSFYVVTQSERKNLYNAGTRSTAFDKALVQGSIDAVYEEFVSKVSAGRNITVDEVKELAQGRVYTGIEAVANGLVDELGGLYESLQKAKELAGFDPEKLYPIIPYEPDSFSLGYCFRNPSECFGGSQSLLPPDVPSTQKIAGIFQRWLPNGNQTALLTLWPGYLAYHLR